MAMILFVPAYESVRVIECSPPSWMAHIALEEKRAPYRIERLSFADGEHRSPEMLARNPRGTIPVLEDGGVTVYETFAVLEYIDAAIAAPPLWPAAPAARARALTRFHESAYLKTAGMALFAYWMRTAADERDPGKTRELQRDFEAELAHWERVAPEAGYLAGELSLADLAVYPYLATAQRLGLPLEAHPRLAAYCARVRERPSVQASWPETWGRSPAPRLWRDPASKEQKAPR